MSKQSNLLFTKEHEWLEVNGNEAKIGITNFAQSELGDIIFVELPDVGDSFDQHEVFGTIEAVKTVADLFMPISGEVISINDKIEDEPELINSNPFEDGWIIKIKIKDDAEKDDLLSDKQYNELINV
ncbi:MAG: glycine cleavage system protein H [Candidatus Marinimicrobia bacterium]|nr:glycine cleavage system protein H [Candidatus Neomarinimicrobiota bacterium]